MLPVSPPTGRTNTRYFTWGDIVDLHDSNVSEKLLFAKLVREDRDLGNKKFYYGLKPSALGINHILVSYAQVLLYVESREQNRAIATTSPMSPGNAGRKEVKIPIPIAPSTAITLAFQ